MARPRAFAPIPAERLRAFRDFLNHYHISFAELARALGVSRVYVSTSLRGRQRIGPARLRTFQQAAREIASLRELAKMDDG